MYVPSIAPPADPFAEAAEAIVGYDYDRLANLLAPDISFRALTPGGLREAAGPQATVRWFFEWFGSGHDHEVLLRDTFTIGSRSGLRLRLRRKLGRTGHSPRWYVIEQHWFGDAGPLGIERLSLVCSGHTPESMPALSSIHDFDAGDLGCSEGLPQEFVRQIRSIPVGDILRVITRDPSARQDLPSMARMNGHHITGPEVLSDGSYQFIVERKR